MISNYPRILKTQNLKPFCEMLKNFSDGDYVQVERVIEDEYEKTHTKKISIPNLSATKEIRIRYCQLMNKDNSRRIAVTSPPPNNPDYEPIKENVVILLCDGSALCSVDIMLTGPGIKDKLPLDRNILENPTSTSVQESQNQALPNTETSFPTNQGKSASSNYRSVNTTSAPKIGEASTSRTYTPSQFPRDQNFPSQDQESISSAPNASRPNTLITYDSLHQHDFRQDVPALNQNLPYSKYEHPVVELSTMQPNQERNTSAVRQVIATNTAGTSTRGTYTFPLSQSVQADAPSSTPEAALNISGIDANEDNRRAKKAKMTEVTTTETQNFPSVQSEKIGVDDEYHLCSLQNNDIQMNTVATHDNDYLTLCLSLSPNAVESSGIRHTTFERSVGAITLSLFDVSDSNTELTLSLAPSIPEIQTPEIQPSTNELWQDNQELDLELKLS